MLLFNQARLQSEINCIRSPNNRIPIRRSQRKPINLENWNWSVLQQNNHAEMERFFFAGHFFLYSGIFEIWLFSLFCSCIVCLLTALLGLFCIVFDVGIWNYEALSHSNLVNVILLILIDRLGLGFRIISAIMNLLFPIWRGNLLECHFWELIDLWWKTRRRMWKSIEVITHFMLDPFWEVGKNIRNV